MSEFKEGDSDTLTKTITERDVEQFAEITGDTNPVHLDEEYARSSRFGQRVAHGMLTASLISAVIGTKLPGAGAIYRAGTFRFIAPVFIGDTVTAEVTIERYDREKGRMSLKTLCRTADGVTVLEGEAEVVYRP